MAAPKRRKGISAHTSTLLREGESKRGDFKRTPEGISTDDLVAFANSEAGGSILAGVDERSGHGGAQVGFIVGCDVSDATILQIANKALSCFPPVAIEISIENLGKVPFLRIDVPPSPTKPHCNPKGVYCRRDGSRNRPLHPSELLQIFLESEARTFAERFESAADRITDDLAQLEASLDRSIKAMADQLGWAQFELGDTESKLDTIQTDVQRLNTETNDLTTRIRAMFRQDKRQDPIYERERKKLLTELIEQLQKDKELLKQIRLGSSVQVSAKGKTAEELTQEDLSQIFHEAVKMSVDQLEKQKYSIEIKTPAECDRGDLEAGAKLIAEGGEVAEGVGKRLKTADVLGLVRYEKKLVGTAALKIPTTNYRNAIFRKAKASAAPADYTRELGWIFLEKEHRSKGQARLLIEALLRSAGARGVFATTRVSNEKMQRILKHQKFIRHGEPHNSTQNPGEEIALFIRHGSKDAQKSSVSSNSAVSAGPGR